jgi:TRAP-type C4-dicarboxylate transport system substrate-binding protein
MKDIFPVINETSHSMFMTILIMNDKFFKKMPEEYQTIVSQAGLEACQLERRVSIKKEEALKKQFAEEGIKTIRLSETERSRLDDVKQRVYKKFIPEYGKDLIEGIINTK